jgi:hypothetical protein
LAASDSLRRRIKKRREEDREMMEKLKKKLLSRGGMAAPLKVVIVIIVIITAALLFEAMRLVIVLRGVSENIGDATHRVILENYETTYTQMRESKAIAERIEPYEILAELTDMIELQYDGSKYISYVEGAKEFELSDVTVQYYHYGDRLTATIEMKCKVFWAMPFSDLPGFTVTIRREAGFISQF